MRTSFETELTYDIRLRGFQGRCVVVVETGAQGVVHRLHVALQYVLAVSEVSKPALRHDDGGRRGRAVAPVACLRERLGRWWLASRAHDCKLIATRFWRLEAGGWRRIVQRFQRAEGWPSGLRQRS